MNDILKSLIKRFMPFAQEKMGFSHPPKLFLRQDQENAANPLGKTGFYDPQAESVTLYTTGRHPKDILRSLAHELMHHTQKCNGDFENVQNMGEQGYAQADPHMRTMEIQAYQASIVFRDWEDSLKETIYYEHLQKGDNSKMSTQDWKNGELKSLLAEKWGFKMNLSKLNESQNPMDPDYYDSEEEQRKIDKRKGRGHRTKENPRGGNPVPVSESEEEEPVKEEVTSSHSDGGKSWKTHAKYIPPSGADDGKKDDEEEEGENPWAKEDAEIARMRRRAQQPTVRHIPENKDEADKNTGMSGVDDDDDDDTYMGHIKEDSGEEEGRHYDDDRMSDDDHIKAIEHHLDALRRDRDYDHDHEELEEGGLARRKGDPRDRRSHESDRIREAVSRLHKAGYSKGQIKEFLSTAYSKALKG